MLFDNKRWMMPKIEPIDKVSRIMHQAADIIDHMGHCKCVLESPDGAHCVLGAIMLASSNGKQHIFYGGDTLLAMDRLSKYLKLSCDTAVVHWNNSFDRTASEVIEALRSA